MTESALSALIEISHFYGIDKDYVIAGGGNTSYKNDTDIWIKASGQSLADITPEGLARLLRKRLQEMGQKLYPTDPVQREAEVKADLYAACHPGNTARPSVETSLHELIRYPFVVHTHPTRVNAITCSKDAEKSVHRLFGNKALYIPFVDPGYVLFTQVRDRLNEWRASHTTDPQMIFLQNHGVFVAGETTLEIRQIYSDIDNTIRKLLPPLPGNNPLPVNSSITSVLPAIRMIFSADEMKVASIRNNSLIEHFVASPENFSGVMMPFSPDQIVYCKARPVFINESDPEAIIRSCSLQYTDYVNRFGYPPKMIAIRNIGLIGVEDHARAAETMLDVFEDWMKISYLTTAFGGPNFMSPRDIAFIDNWEVENYRRQVAKSSAHKGRAEGKIAIVTGAASGFGAGITKWLHTEGAHVVVADLNEAAGKQIESGLNALRARNKACFVKTDVTDAASVERMVHETICTFGGLDVLISNAGILHAGSIDEMSPETFDRVTRVNYTGYFLCVKYVVPVLKLQARLKPDLFTDIIQINSKSGLKGSNRNFAYSGGKFGGIGLTQSFALELIPFKVKVNAVCPGNFFEGPLWSHPENGLFVQYLRTGKVPGAETTQDVKAHYEKQVPAGRGCRVEDVMKAIFYLIEQEYETGQALPVTGGQEMLS